MKPLRLVTALIAAVSLSVVACIACSHIDPSPPRAHAENFAETEGPFTRLPPCGHTLDASTPPDNPAMDAGLDQTFGIFTHGDVGVLAQDGYSWAWAWIELHYPDSIGVVDYVFPPQQLFTQARCGGIEAFWSERFAAEGALEDPNPPVTGYLDYETGLWDAETVAQAWDFPGFAVDHPDLANSANDQQIVFDEGDPTILVGYTVVLTGGGDFVVRPDVGQYAGRYVQAAGRWYQ